MVNVTAFPTATFAISTSFTLATMERDDVSTITMKCVPVVPTPLEAPTVPLTAVTVPACGAVRVALAPGVLPGSVDASSLARVCPAVTCWPTLTSISDLARSDKIGIVQRPLDWSGGAGRDVQVTLDDGLALIRGLRAARTEEGKGQTSEDDH